jgi:RES domain-containing protein
MILWRISNYADLLGIGGIEASARWHTAGRPIVYLAENPSSALLEILVHLEADEEDRPDSYQILKVETAEDMISERRRDARHWGMTGWKERRVRCSVSHR